MSVIVLTCPSSLQVTPHSCFDICYCQLETWYWGEGEFLLQKEFYQTNICSACVRRLSHHPTQAVHQHMASKQTWTKGHKTYIKYLHTLRVNIKFTSQRPFYLMLLNKPSFKIGKTRQSQCLHFQTKLLPCFLLISCSHSNLYTTRSIEH